MNQNSFLKIIENLNYQYLCEKEKNKKSGKLKLLFNSIKTGNIIYALKRLKKKKYGKNLDFTGEYLPINIVSDNSVKVAVYTCITGNYDGVCEPYIKESNCDYFLFTNNKQIKSSGWEVKSIPDNILKLNDNVLINRYIKMHPYELFENNYDYAIYIDGNISIVSDISSFTKIVSKKLGLAFHKHYSKECLYDEMKTCQVVGKGDPTKIKLQEKQYRKEGFPENYGMFECNVIVSDMKNLNGKKIMNSWWDEFKNSSSMRDQICLPYCLWKEKYKCSDIGIIGDNVFLNPKIRINNHK